MTDDSDYSGGYDSGSSGGHTPLAPSTSHWDAPQPVEMRLDDAIDLAQRQTADLDEIGDYGHVPPGKFATGGIITAPQPGIMPPDAHMGEPYDGAYVTGRHRIFDLGHVHDGHHGHSGAVLDGSELATLGGMAEPGVTISFDPPLTVVEVAPELITGELVEDPGDLTRLESGQVLRHHEVTECTGNCCLHGTSPFGSCKWPRAWRHDEQRLVHLCRHDVQHPCEAGVDYRNRGLADGDPLRDEGDHPCDLCCWVEDGHMTAEERLEHENENLAERLDIVVRNLADVADIASRASDGLAQALMMQLETLKTIKVLRERVDICVDTFAADEHRLDGRLTQLENAREDNGYMLSERIARLEAAQRGWWWKWSTAAFAGYLLSHAVVSAVVALLK